MLHDLAKNRRQFLFVLLLIAHPLLPNWHLLRDLEQTVRHQNPRVKEWVIKDIQSVTGIKAEKVANVDFIGHTGVKSS